MEEGKGLRAVGFALLMLSATVAAPALSAAQDPASPPPPAEPVPLTPPPAPPPDPAKPAPDPAADRDPRPEPAPAEIQEQATPVAPAAATATATAAAPAPKLAKAAAATVSVGDNFYAPASVSVFVGESVTWKNNGASPHSATANGGSFDTGVFDPGQSRSATFSRAGTFSYYCTVHGLSQAGTVRVAAAASGGGGGGSGGSTASGSSEAAAVAAPDAAGTSTSLPATGFAVLGLGLVGLALVASGVAVDRAVPGSRRRRRPGRIHSIF